MTIETPRHVEAQNQALQLEIHLAREEALLLGKKIKRVHLGRKLRKVEARIEDLKAQLEALETEDAQVSTEDLQDAEYSLDGQQIASTEFDPAERFAQDEVLS